MSLADRPVGNNIIFYFEQKFEKNNFFRFGNSETEHLLPSEMAHADFGPFPNVNVVKGRAELLSDPVSIMRCVKQGLH